MTKGEIVSYVFEDMLPEIKKELMIKDYKNLSELYQGAQLVEQALKIFPNYEIKEAENDKQAKLS